MSAAASTANLVAKPPIHPPSFDSLQPDRTDEIFLYDESLPELEYRYKIRVVDRPLLLGGNKNNKKPRRYHTAVFSIPAGRESEYLFRTGLASIADSAQTVRLLAVSFGRKHVFRDQAAVQAELTHVVQVLSRQGAFVSSKSNTTNTTLSNLSAEIPFMALDGIGARNCMAEGATKVSGKYFVEQVQVGAQTVRRLYFLDNPFVIQSEVYLRQADDNDGNKQIVDKSTVAFEYHKRVVAGLLSLGTSQTRGLLIGLGGGGLVNFIRSLLPDLKINAVELDGGMVQVAQTYFGLETESPQHFEVCIGNGLDVCASTRIESGDNGKDARMCFEGLDWIVIDVDSKDKTVGMSCPPQAFCETAYLEQLREMLTDTGVLAMNVSARDPTMLPMVCRNVQSVFSTVLLSVSAEGEEEEEGDGETKEDVNVVLIATCAKIQLPSTKDLRDHLQSVLPSTADEVVVADLMACLDDLSEWNEQGDDAGKTKAGKKKPKRRKRGKKK